MNHCEIQKFRFMYFKISSVSEILRDHYNQFFIFYNQPSGVRKVFENTFCQK